MDFSHDLDVRLKDQTGLDPSDLKGLHNRLYRLVDGLHDLQAEETLASPLYDQVNVLRVEAGGALSEFERLMDQLHYVVRYRP
jgi:hypothetical protein